MSSKRLFGTDLITWVEVAGDQATIGFTGYACERMEELAAVELRQPGDKVYQGEPCGAVDLMKAFVDIPCPISGSVTATNPKVIATPELINEDPAGEGWLLQVQLSDGAQLEGLLSAEQYEARTTPK